MVFGKGEWERVVGLWVGEVFAVVAHGEGAAHGLVACSTGQEIEDGCVRGGGAGCGGCEG